MQVQLQTQVYARIPVRRICVSGQTGLKRHPFRKVQPVSQNRRRRAADTGTHGRTRNRRRARVDVRVYRDGVVVDLT